uniref:Uncharacterized protein n=1 Tax=Escherichia coli TaxID=562 RepID=A0A3G4RXG1_ECOLX|nr:hypothetical protein D0362_00195 [Escherichia coli]
MHSIHVKSGRDTTHLKTTRRLSLKHWSTKTVIFSAESWPCFQIEPAAGTGKTPFCLCLPLAQFENMAMIRR